MTKEMIYKPQMHEAEVLESNTYNGFNYTVVSYGTHPCCYVEIPRKHPLHKQDYWDIDIQCHGGLTFSEFRDFGKGSKWYIGWDYGHCGDYQGYYEVMGFADITYKKWTTEELIQECKNVIDQLSNYKTISIMDKIRHFFREVCNSFVYIFFNNKFHYYVDQQEYEQFVQWRDNND